MTIETFDADGFDFCESLASSPQCNEIRARRFHTVAGEFLVLFSDWCEWDSERRDEQSMPCDMQYSIWGQDKKVKCVGAHPESDFSEIEILMQVKVKRLAYEHLNHWRGLKVSQVSQND